MSVMHKRPVKLLVQTQTWPECVPLQLLSLKAMTFQWSSFVPNVLQYLQNGLLGG